MVLCLLLLHSFAFAAECKVGINLAGPADWNTEQPFVDVFRMSRLWISQRQGQPWGKGPTLDLDENGWVKRLEDDGWAETLVCTVEGGRYPGGEYLLLYEGRGRIEVGGAATIRSSRPGRMVLDVDSSKGTIFLRLKETDPDNYVRNIRLIMPGFETAWQTNPWHPAFLERWKGMHCLRFMDFMHTNSSEIVSWLDRPAHGDATWSVKGVPLEEMIDLVNRLKADPWFCMPHKADDDYVRQFAAMVRDRLDPDRKVYVEYSNEVWNGIFFQHRYAQQQGLELGFGDAEHPWQAAWEYTAHRSVQIFQIWEEVFGGAERLVRVLPGWAAVAHVSKTIVEFEDAWRHADVLAIAPYMSCNVGTEGEKVNQAVAEQWTVDQALDYMESVALPEAVEWIRQSKAVADEHGLDLICYEAGQHMVGVSGVENNDTITKLFHRANAHPRMGKIYDRYHAAWDQAGGGLMCHFSSVSRWSKWGSWGLLQYPDDDLQQAFKFMSVIRFANQCGQPVSIPWPHGRS